MALPLIAIELGVLALDFVYHRYIADQPKPPPPGVVTLPTLAVGAPYPLIWGTTRVRAPVFAWSTPYGIIGPDGDPAPETSFIGANIQYAYTLDQLLVLGIGFESGVHHLLNMWAGDVKLQNQRDDQPPLSSLTGNGNFENWKLGILTTFPHAVATPAVTARKNLQPQQILSEGVVEFLNGNSNQTIIDPATLAPTTDLGRFMVAAGRDPAHITGYRGFISAFLYNLSLVGGGPGVPVTLDDGSSSLDGPTTFAKYQHWLTGADTTQIPTYSFEVSSFARNPLSLAVGVDANIVDVIYDIVCGTLGKLGLPSSLVDTANFAAAGIVLYAEGNGYSRTIEQATAAKGVINELCAQADAVLYVDPVAGLIRIKLVRFDYDPNAVPEVNVDNCEDITNLVVTSWTGTPNRIRVTFTDRAASDYKDNSVWAANQANAVGQNGDTIEQQLAFPGITTYTNAVAVATRELAARSRPIAQCQAVVGRQFYNTVPGDVVAITWPDYGWVRVLFRVAAVNRGTLADGRVKLSLVQEYFNVNRGTQQTGGIASGPATGVGGAAQ